MLFPWKCHHWVWGTRTFEQVAVLLRRKYPTFGDQLLGVVDLARQRAAGKTSALADAAIQHVDALVQKNDFHSAVPQPRHRQWAAAVLVPAAICLVAWVAAPSAARNAVFRWLTPWRPVDRFTFTQFQSLPREIVVPQGEPFALHTELAPSSEWAPATATLSIGQREPISVERRDQSYDFEVPPHSESIDAELSAGDYRAVMRVLPTARPEMKSLQAQVELPGYLQQKNSRRLMLGVAS